MKRKFSGLIFLVISLAGLALVLYPTVSDTWNRRTSSRAIARYDNAAAVLDDASYVAEWKNAREFNKKLRSLQGYTLPDDMMEEYNSLLDVTGFGIIGYLNIPDLDISLPVYHGTEAGVLQVAVGHLEWTSLPTGGVGTHCVLVAHRGLSSAKLFTDLPKMKCGDVFFVHVLDELLTYEVDQILTVEPTDLSELTVDAGMDYFTLMTCTPYGINSHRLLVRGHRIPNFEDSPEAVFVPSEAVTVDPLIVAPFIAMPILLTLFAVQSARDRRRNKR